MYPMGSYVHTSCLTGASKCNSDCVFLAGRTRIIKLLDPSCVVSQSFESEHVKLGNLIHLDCLASAVKTGKVCNNCLDEINAVKAEISAVKEENKPGEACEPAIEEITAGISGLTTRVSKEFGIKPKSVAYLTVCLSFAAVALFIGIVTPND
jgi:hypothetical protein